MVAEKLQREIPQCSVIRTSTAGGPGSLSGWGTRILQAMWCSPKKLSNMHKTRLSVDPLMKKVMSSSQEPNPLFPLEGVVIY